MREDPLQNMESEITFPDDNSEDSAAIDVGMLARKRRYLDRILSLVGREGAGADRPLNVAIIGPPGVGKSSFINTVGAAFSSERWREYAAFGHHGGDADPISTFTATFKKCCNERDYEQYQLPTLIDIAGFPNEDKKKWQELLRIVFYGRLPEGQALGQAEEMCEKYGLTKLYEHYSRNEERLKVDRIIFVASATQEVPSSLISCVLAAARPSGREDNPATRSIPVFGVMTKQDKLASEDGVLQERQKKFMEALGLGNAGHRFLLCSNYCDEVDNGERTERVLPHLDMPVLKFLSQVFDPVIRVLNPSETMTEALQLPAPPPSLVETVSTQETARQAPTGQAAQPGCRLGATAEGVGLRLRRQLQQLGLTDQTSLLVLIAVEAVIVAGIFHYVLHPTVDVVDMRAACETLHDTRLHDKDVLTRNPGLRVICESLDMREHLRLVYQTAGLFLFLLLRFGVTFITSLLQRNP